MLSKIFSFKKILSVYISSLGNKSKNSIYICLGLGIISLFLDSASIVSLSRLEILSNIESPIIKESSSLSTTLLLLLTIAIFNIIKTLIVARSSSLIAADISKSIYQFHLEKKSQFKDDFNTENIGKNVTRELIRGAFACFLLLPINILSLIGILIGLKSGLGASAIKLSIVIIFTNLSLVLFFGNFANKLQYKGTKAEKDLEIISKEILNESEEIVISNLAEKRLNILQNIIFKTRVNLTYALSFFRVPGTIYPVINIAIILLAIKLNFLSYEILVPFIYSMQRGNLSFSSFISSMTSIIGSRRQLKLVSDLLRDKNNKNLNYKIHNRVKKISKIYINKIFSISFPKTKRVDFKDDSFLAINKIISNKEERINLGFVSRPIVIYGDSGSGKSTYLKEIIGLTGKNKLDCCCIYQNKSLKKPISLVDLRGYFASQDVIIPRTTLKEYLSFYSDNKSKNIYNLFQWNKKNKLLWSDIIKFDEWINKDLTKASYGELKRLKLLKAYLSDSNWIALDEPTSGLDPLSVLNVINAINDLSKRSIVVLCTHEKKLIENSLISIKIRNN